MSRPAGRPEAARGGTGRPAPDPVGTGTAVFLQVRLGSARLPRKALLPLAGRTVLDHVLEALRAVPADRRVLLTDRLSAAELEGYAGRHGFDLFVGPQQDVLERFCLAWRRWRPRRVIRATGDNPLVSPRLAELLLEEHAARGADLSHYLGCPLGTGVEVMEAEALLEAGREAGEPFEREHLTQYLYRHRERFRVEEIECPGEYALPGARVTLDTEEDYRKIEAIFRELYRGRPIETEEIVTWLRRP